MRIAFNAGVRFWAVFLLQFSLLALLLKLVLGIDILNTALVVSGWLFIGHLVTIDDELPGGFFNPDGATKPPWLELTAKAIAFGATLILKYLALAG